MHVELSGLADVISETLNDGLSLTFLANDARILRLHKHCLERFIFMDLAKRLSSSKVSTYADHLMDIYIPKDVIAAVRSAGAHAEDTDCLLDILFGPETKKRIYADSRSVIFDIKDPVLASKIRTVLNAPIDKNVRAKDRLQVIEFNFDNNECPNTTRVDKTIRTLLTSTKCAAAGVSLGRLHTLHVIGNDTLRVVAEDRVTEDLVLFIDACKKNKNFFTGMLREIYNLVMQQTESFLTDALSGIFKDEPYHLYSLEPLSAYTYSISFIDDVRIMEWEYINEHETLYASEQKLDL